VTREMGLEVSLHGSNSEPLMSALGQKRTSDCHPLMSAIPPKADIAERRLDARFVPITDIAKARPLRPSKRRSLTLS
jgi:hypothetical protein